VKIHLHSRHATLPTKSTPLAAGFDLYSANELPIKLLPLSTIVIQTDLSVELPAGTYGRIAERSGLAAKSSIGVGAGVIDRDYRGKIGVVLRNFDKNAEFLIQPRMRVAQLIFERCLEDVVWEETEDVNELEASKRGTLGFGSSGE